MYKQTINNLKIFKGCKNSDFIVRLLTNFIPLFSKKNAILIHEGQLVENIMFVKRSTKRKDTVSSEENDYEETYATINFQVEFPTERNQKLYIVGNVEELGNWDLNKGEKLIKLDEQSSLWETTHPLECPVGMTIKYKYLLIDFNNNKILEKLPNNSERSITTKKAGQYIIMNKKGDLSTKISFVGKERRDFKRKLSRTSSINESTITSHKDKIIKKINKRLFYIFK